MKRTLISFLLLAIALIILLTACAAPTPAPTATPTPLPTATITPLPSATATITPTLVEPSMANLPVEWADRIDRIETMVEMDGKTTRVVAIQRSEDPTKDSKLRALQWDPDAGEWVKYHPQIGWVGWGDQDFGFGEGQHSTWIEDINLPERKTLANPLRYTDGTEIPLGYLGPLYYEKDRSENGTRAEFFQGYVLEVRLGEPLSNSSSNSRMLFLYTGIPLESGDWIVFVSSAIDQDTEVSKAWSLERLTNGDFGKMDAGLMETPSESITYSRLREYLLTHQEELVGQPTIQGIGIDPGGNYPEKEDELRFYDALKRGEPVDAGGTYPVFSSPGFVSEAWWNQVVDWSENR